MTTGLAFGLLAFFAFAFPGSATGEGKDLSSMPYLRILPSELGRALCKNQFDRKTFWSVNVYDAQVEGIFVSVRPDATISDKELERRAGSRAQELGYGNFSYGRCAKDKGWVVAFPSPSPLSYDRKSGVVKVSGTDSCSGALSVRAVKQSGGQSYEIPGVNGTFAIVPTSPETVSVECIPKNKSKSPEEWFLFPTASFDLNAPVNHLPKLITGKGVDVVGWISAMRQAEGLSKIASDSALNEDAKQLEQDRSVRHDFSQLVGLRERLEKKGLGLIGENRVKAPSEVEALNLLWMSPRHRDLLLDRTLDLVGVHVRRDKDGVFIGIIGVHRQGVKK